MQIVRGEHSYVVWPKSKLYYLIIRINNEPILTSTLAAGIVQHTLVRESGEDEGGEEETTGATSSVTSTAQVEILLFHCT